MADLTGAETLNGMNAASRSQFLDLVGQWRSILSSPALSRRVQAFRDAHAVLAQWRQEGLVKPGWRLDWDAETREWRVMFTVCGSYAVREMTAAEFTWYVQGFNDRRTAVMHRTL